MLQNVKFRSNFDLGREKQKSKCSWTRIGRIETSCFWSNEGYPGIINFPPYSILFHDECKSTLFLKQDSINKEMETKRVHRKLEDTRRKIYTELKTAENKVRTAWKVSLVLNCFLFHVSLYHRIFLSTN